MRVVRATGQNVSPSDDGRLYAQVFTDGLFEDATFVNLGGNDIQIGALYGDLCGRDFTVEQMTLEVVLPEDGEGETTGYIYVEFDTSSEDVISINSALAPFTPTYEDINTNGAIAQMILAEYTASAVAVQSVTPVYKLVSAGSVLPGSVATFEQSPAISNHSVGEFILYEGQLYKVISAITAGQSLTPGSNIRSTSAGDELTSLNSNLNNLACGNTITVVKTLATSGTAESYTIPTTGWYFVRALCLSVSGTASAFIYSNIGLDPSVLIAASESQEGVYKRVTTAPILFKAGTTIAVRAFFTDSAVICRLS